MAPADEKRDLQPDGAAGAAPEGAALADPQAGPEPRATADGSLTLYDPAAGQTYHSGRGAWTETLHVFLGASGMAERLAAGRAGRVVEVGLGTGLNLLATLDAAAFGGAALHYRALELRPPRVATVRTLDFGRHLRRPELADAWLAVLADLAEHGRPGAVHRVPSGLLPPGTTLEVALGDATSGPTGAPSPAASSLLEPGWADAIYHDAFSPDASPGLWSDVFLGACARSLAPGGTWVSYSVAGTVRRRLTGHGLRVEKLPGPVGGKREMLRAVRPREAASDPTASPRR